MNDPIGILSISYDDGRNPIEPWCTATLLQNGSVENALYGKFCRPLDCRVWAYIEAALQSGVYSGSVKNRARDGWLDVWHWQTVFFPEAKNPERN